MSDRSEELRSLGAFAAQMAVPTGVLRTVLEQSPMPYTIFSQAGRCVFANAAHQRMFGAVAPPAYSLFEDEMVRALGLLEAVHRAFAGEVVRTAPFWYDPAQLRHVDLPHAKKVAIACQVVPLGAPATHILIAYDDVTAALTADEMVQREKAVAAEKERQLQTLLDTLPAGILFAEAPSGRITLINMRAEQILGRRAVLPGSIEDFATWQGLHAHGRPILATEWPLARAVAGETVLAEELQFLTPEQGKRWLRASAAPMRAEGRVVGAVVVFDDIEPEALRVLSRRERSARPDHGRRAASAGPGAQ